MRKMGFDSLTIDTLNDIAILLSAIQSISQMGITFCKNPKFDWPTAELKVLELSVLIKHLNCDLMMALHTKSSIRQHAVMKVQIKSFQELCNIVDIANQLCQEEIAVLGTNFIREKAAIPLKNIRDSWNAKCNKKVKLNALDFSPKNDEKSNITVSTRDKLRSMCSGKINYKLAAELISKETNRPISIDAIKSWTCDSNSKRARPCPNWAILALEKSLQHFLSA